MCEEVESCPPKRRFPKVVGGEVTLTGLTPTPSGLWVEVHVELRLAVLSWGCDACGMSVLYGDN